MPRSRRPDILRVLEEAEGPLTVAALAKAVGCAYSTAGGYLQRLAATGQACAEQVPSPQGGPSTLLYMLIEQRPSPFDGDPFWADVAAAMKHAAREREEKDRGQG